MQSGVVARSLLFPDAFTKFAPSLTHFSSQPGAGIPGVVMSQKWSALAGLLAVIVVSGLLLSLSSCARDKQLVAITIQPASGTFLSPEATGSIQFTAIGSYIHPPVSSDITNQVTWKSDVPGIVNIIAGTVTTTGSGCGIANISASTTQGTGHSGNLVIGYATVTVNDPTVLSCPGGSVGQGSVLVAVSGNGKVVSVPSGINCPGTCGALFSIGNQVVLNATPGSGATTVLWGGACMGTTGNSCAVLVGIKPVTATATFQ
jgi:hypothetical protein